MDKAREKELLSRIGRFQEILKERNSQISELKQELAEEKQNNVDLSLAFEALKLEHVDAIELKRKKTNQSVGEPTTSDSNRSSVYCFYDASTGKILEFGKDSGSARTRENDKIRDTLNNAEGAKFDNYRNLLNQGKLGVLRVFTELDHDTAKVNEFLLIRAGKNVGECKFNEVNGSCDVPGYELKTADELDDEGAILLEGVRKMFGKQHVYSFDTIQNYKPTVQKRMRICTGECGQLKDFSRGGTVCDSCRLKEYRKNKPMAVCKDPLCNRAGQEVKIKSRDLCYTCYKADRNKPKKGD